MIPHAAVDLHCDTLTAPGGTGCADTLDDPEKALSLSALPAGVRWAQCFAIFIPDTLRGQAAIAYYDRWRESFWRQMGKFSDRVLPCHDARDMDAAWAAGKAAAFLTVENGSAFAGNVERVRLLAEQGVRAVTLTWNGENELGSGHETDRGLTGFGRRAVREMERLGVLVDASHLNDRGFFDLLDIAEKPFLATHSNARSVCAHKRNLTDEMIRELARRGCLVGLNYYVRFLRDDGAPCGLDDLYRHAMRFFELGAKQNLALGSDFDGAEVPDCLSSPTRALDFYAYLLARGIPREDADGVFWRNARTFFLRNLPQGAPMNVPLLH